MTEADKLSQAIAIIWDDVTHALGGNRESFERQLITLLRRLQGTQGQEQIAVIRLILELFQKSENVHKQLIQAISRLTTDRTKGANIPVGSVKVDRYTAVPICYGTDRAITSAPGEPLAYGSDRGNLTLGFAEVSIPDDHRMGEIEKPRLWKLQFREDPQKHVVVLKVELLLSEAFAERARGALNQSLKKEVLLFVHGYNVGFADAVCRAAQIAYDLHFEGLAALYSWTSEGSTPKYVVDETNITWSRPRFAKFLSVLREGLGAEAVHIIAHSMGNRLVAETIASMTTPITSGGARMCQIVFAAPDIDAATFKDLAKAFSEKAERFTLYASSDDKAIKASRLIHKYPRAGDSGLGLTVVGSVDTVDATAVDTSFVGHSYYGDNRSVLTDVFELIRRGSPPEERFGLVPKNRYGARYWLFSP